MLSKNTVNIYIDSCLTLHCEQLYILILVFTLRSCNSVVSMVHNYGPLPLTRNKEPFIVLVLFASIPLIRSSAPSPSEAHLLFSNFIEEKEEERSPKKRSKRARVEKR